MSPVTATKYDKRFAKLIVAKRNMLGLTQDQVAKKLKISRSQYANMETGRCQFLLIRVMQLAKILNIPTGFL